MDIVIKSNHRDNGGEFFIENENGEKVGILNYTLFGSGRLIIQHTEVGGELKGTGTSGKLVVAAADYARSNNLKIIPICPFAKSYMQRKQEQFADVLV